MSGAKIRQGPKATLQGSDLTGLLSLLASFRGRGPFCSPLVFPGLFVFLGVWSVAGAGILAYAYGRAHHLF
jgi:hypothetical protein